MKILIINGVNLGMTGKRGEKYGTRSLEDINAQLTECADQLGLTVEFFQSDIEGEIVGRINAGGFDGLIINPGAYSHYSIAIRDALEPLALPKIEVHMTNIHAREPFRQHSVVGEVCDGMICGFMADSYRLALTALSLRK